MCVRVHGSIDSKMARITLRGGTVRVIFDRKTKVMCTTDRCTVDANEQQQTNNPTIHDGIMPNEGKDESIQRSTSVLSNQNHLGNELIFRSSERLMKA